MTKMPTEFNGSFGYIEVKLSESCKKESECYIYEYRVDKLGIHATFIWDFFSSIWILDKSKFDTFPITYRVESGGWYGYDKSKEWIGGRWSTLKRISGEIIFHNVNKTKINSSEAKRSFKIIKRRFKNGLKVEISNKEIGSLEFYCSDIEIVSSQRISLFNKNDNKFVDFTDNLCDDGMKLI